MLSSDQAQNIIHIYGKFLASEEKGWNQLDDYLELLEFLDDQEMYSEADILYSIHKTKKMGCPYIHKEGAICFVTGILEAVEAILDLYKETNSLHPENRYLLANYLALCQDGQICEIPDSGAI